MPSEGIEFRSKNGRTLLVAQLPKLGIPGRSDSRHVCDHRLKPVLESDSIGFCQDERKITYMESTRNLLRMIWTSRSYWIFVWTFLSRNVSGSRKRGRPDAAERDRVSDSSTSEGKENVNDQECGPVIF
jgi:hypothetical protein